jgi:hypothetical protein
MVDDNGAPLLVRHNETAGQWAGRADLPIKLGLAVPLNRPHPGALPEEAENALLLEVEEVISRHVLARATGFHALTLTNGVMKEWVFYIAQGADIAALHAGIQAEVASHDVQCMAEEDPQWDTYRSFVP